MWLTAPPFTPTQMSGRSPSTSYYVICDTFHYYFRLLFLICKMLIRSIKSVECCCCCCYFYLFCFKKKTENNKLFLNSVYTYPEIQMFTFPFICCLCLEAVSLLFPQNISLSLSDMVETLLAMSFFFLKKYVFIYFHVYVCYCMSSCVPHALWRPEQDIRSPRIRVAGHCGPPCGC